MEVDSDALTKIDTVNRYPIVNNFPRNCRDDKIKFG